MYIAKSDDSECLGHLSFGLALFLFNIRSLAICFMSYVGRNHENFPTNPKFSKSYFSNH